MAWQYDMRGVQCTRYSIGAENLPDVVWVRLVCIADEPSKGASGGPSGIFLHIRMITLMYSLHVYFLRVHAHCTMHTTVLGPL